MSVVWLLIMLINRFQYMAVADDRQRKMPLPDDRLPERCQALDFPEAVLLTNPIEEEFKGEVCFFFHVSSPFRPSCTPTTMRVMNYKH